MLCKLRVALLQIKESPLLWLPCVPRLVHIQSTSANLTPQHEGSPEGHQWASGSGKTATACASDTRSHRLLSKHPNLKLLYRNTLKCLLKLNATLSRKQEPRIFHPLKASRVELTVWHRFKLHKVTLDDPLEDEVLGEQLVHNLTYPAEVSYSQDEGFRSLRELLPQRSQLMLMPTLIAAHRYYRRQRSSTIIFSRYPRSRRLRRSGKDWFESQRRQSRRSCPSLLGFLPGMQELPIR